MLEESEAGGVVTLRLAHGKASAIDLDLAGAITARLDALGRSGARALVLTGTGGIFSAGVDLFKLASAASTSTSSCLRSTGCSRRSLCSPPRSSPP